MLDERIGRERAWIIQAILVTWAIYFYIFIEWLFFVTKQSFMSSFSAPGTVRILLATPAPFIGGGLVAVILLGTVSGTYRLSQMPPTLIESGLQLETAHDRTGFPR